MKSEVMAQVLSEAQPYILKYWGKTIVVKYGGSAMIDPVLKSAVMNDLITLTLMGVRIVLVHGGGPEINDQLNKIGKKPEFINGLRKTDSETIEVVQQVLAGKVNKDLVALLRGHGVGLCGMDGSMFECKKESGDVDLGYVGEITKVDPKLVTYLLDNSFIPVIATVGMDKNSVAYNINADTAASELAIALGATKMISMTDVAGILRDKNDESTLISAIEMGEVDTLIQSGVIAGGMVPKIASCVKCIENGVKEVAIIDGRMLHSVIMEIFSDKGSGTLFYKKSEDENG